MTCPNCGARLDSGRCGQCRAVVPGPLETLTAPVGLEIRDEPGQLWLKWRWTRLEVGRGQVIARRWLWRKTLSAGQIDRLFAMPVASTLPQSARPRDTYWVCAAVKPTRERIVLVRGLAGLEAAAFVAQAVARRLDLAP